MKKILLLLTCFISNHAFAVPISNDITCAEAQAYVARNGVIHTRANGRDVVPIYGFENSCARDYTLHPVYLVTRDNRSCLVGYRCYYDGDWDD